MHGSPPYDDSWASCLHRPPGQRRERPNTLRTCYYVVVTYLANLPKTKLLHLHVKRCYRCKVDAWCSFCCVCLARDKSDITTLSFYLITFSLSTEESWCFFIFLHKTPLITKSQCQTVITGEDDVFFVNFYNLRIPYFLSCTVISRVLTCNVLLLHGKMNDTVTTSTLCAEAGVSAL